MMMTIRRIFSLKTQWVSFTWLCLLAYHVVLQGRHCYTLWFCIPLQSHTTEIRNVPEIHNVPEMLPYLFTPEAVQENSTLLEQLPQWAACSVTQALAFLTPAYASNPHVKAYVLRVLDSYSPDSVTRFLSQLVQALRYGDEVRHHKPSVIRCSFLIYIFVFWLLHDKIYSHISFYTKYHRYLPPSCAEVIASNSSKKYCMFSYVDMACTGWSLLTFVALSLISSYWIRWNIPKKYLIKHMLIHILYVLFFSTYYVLWMSGGDM